MTIDLLPTLAKLAGAELPKDRVIDGRDIWPVLSGKQKKGLDKITFYTITIKIRANTATWRMMWLTPKRLRK